MEHHPRLIYPAILEMVCLSLQTELEEKYGKKKFIDLGSIPDSWTKITKEGVLDALKN